MAFKYVNPGYEAMFDINGGTLKPALPDSGFYMNEGAVYFRSPTGGYTDYGYVYTPNLKEIWFKETIWLNSIRSSSSSTPSVLFSIKPNSYSSDTGIRMGTSGGKWVAVFNGQQRKVSDLILAQTPYVIKGHIKVGKEDGELDLYINDELFYQEKGNVNSGEALKTVYVGHSAYGVTYNIIIADTNIWDENIAVCKIKDVSGSWENVDSAPNATDVEQTLSCAIDVDELKERLKTDYVNPQISCIGFSGRAFSFDSTKVNALKGRLTTKTSDVMGNTNKITPTWQANSNGCSPFLFDVPTMSLEQLKSVQMHLISKWEAT